MQLHSWGRGSAQHVLQGWQAGIILRGELGLLLLEDGQSEHITATHGRGLSGREPQEPICKERAKLEKCMQTEGGDQGQLSKAYGCVLVQLPTPHITNSMMLQTEQTSL